MAKRFSTIYFVWTYFVDYIASIDNMCTLTDAVNNAQYITATVVL